MLKKVIKITLFFLISCQISACVNSAAPTILPTATATLLPSPSATLIPTTTPFASVTPEAPPETVKQVLLQYGIFGGSASVSQSDFFLGRDTPAAVIYTDGQMILTQEHAFLTTRLTPADLCGLLKKIQQTGFFSGTIYASPPPTQGATVQTMIIQVNGTPAHLAFFDKNNFTYLSSALVDTLHLLEDYKPAGLVYYEPQRMLLWVETANSSDYRNQTVYDWPVTLPAIHQIWQDPTSHQVLVEGQNGAAILQVFGHRLQAMYFRDQNEVYRLIARPLLPHENSKRLSIIPDRAESFPLPLICTAQAEYLPSPTPTLTPLPEAATSTPTLSPARAALIGRGRVLFTSDRTGNQQIYMLNSDGANLERLTNHLYNDLSPSWSPDGKRVAFISNRDGNDELYLMDADGKHQQRLTRTVDDEGAPDWSPDGQHLVFTRRCNTLENCTSQQDLYVIDQDGNNLRRLTDTFDNEFLPAWSPDGQQIAYVLGNTQGSSIYSMNTNGTERKLLVGDAQINASMPAWSPDGARLAYVVWNPPGSGSSSAVAYQSELYVANADGSQAQRLTNEQAQISQPTWSPDGGSLAFSLRRRDPTGEHIFTLPVESASGLSPLTEGSQNDTRPSWGP